VASPTNSFEPSPVVDVTAIATAAVRPTLYVGVGVGVVGLIVFVGVGLGVTVGLIVFVGPGDGDALPEAEGDADGDMACILPCQGPKVHGTVTKLGCGWSLRAAAKNLAHIGAQYVPP
jgi:hypothetical protein